MISARHKFIFLHVPKTAGNSIQTWLLPHSDDQKVVSGAQDGVETFNIKGAITPTKHASLQKYADALGPGLADYRVLIAVRDPLDRILSLYFSPHRAAGRPPGFRPAYEPQFFAGLLRETPAMVDYLTVDGVVQRPDMVIRYEHLAADLAEVAKQFDLSPAELPVLNRSLDQRGDRDQLKQDRDVVSMVSERFAEDYRYFGYEVPGSA